jgi:hypothetical protein
MDPYRTWHPHPKRGDKADAVTSINRDEFYGTLEELQVQQAEDLASQVRSSSTSSHAVKPHWL